MAVAALGLVAASVTMLVWRNGPPVGTWHPIAG
jgi:hypothetical protein